jgi:hypothetical protein
MVRPAVSARTGSPLVAKRRNMLSGTIKQQGQPPRLVSKPVECIVSSSYLIGK